jgi:hypothetical protein
MVGTSLSGSQIDFGALFEIVLTASRVTAIEDGGDIWIHQDHALLLPALFMPLVHAQVNLVLEILADDGIDYVGDIASRELQPLSL